MSSISYRLREFLPTIFHFLDTHKEPFVIDELLAVLPKPKRPRIFKQEIIDLLTIYRMAFFIPKNYKTKNKWIGKTAFFSGKQFVILPTEFEKNEKLLIAGTRVLPFMFPQLYPHEASFSYKGKPLPVKKINLTFSDIQTYYQWQPFTEICQALCNNAVENAVTINKNPSLIKQQSFTVSAVDFSAVSADQTGSENGFLIQVTDWLNGKFEIIKKMQYINDHISDELFPGFLSAIFDCLPLSASLGEHLGNLFFAFEDSLFKDCFFCLDHLFKQEHVLELKTVGIIERFLPEDVSFEHLQGWYETPQAMDDDMDSFLFLGLEIPMTEAIASRHSN